MKLQILATITLALLTAVPGVFSEEPKADIAKSSITNLNGVFDAIADEVAELYDEDEEFDAETGETSVGKKSKRSSKKKKRSKKKRSKRKKSRSKRRKYSSRSYSGSRRSYRYYYDDWIDNRSYGRSSSKSGKSSKDDFEREMIKGSVVSNSLDAESVFKKDEKKKKKSSSRSDKEAKSSKSSGGNSRDKGDPAECISLGETAGSMISYAYCGQGYGYSHSSYSKDCRSVAINQCKGSIYGKVNDACGAPDTSTLRGLQEQCDDQVDELLGINDVESFDEYDEEEKKKKKKYSSSSSKSNKKRSGKRKRKKKNNSSSKSGKSSADGFARVE